GGTPHFHNYSIQPTVVNRVDTNSNHCNSTTLKLQYLQILPFFLYRKNTWRQFLTVTTYMSRLNCRDAINIGFCSCPKFGATANKNYSTILRKPFKRHRLASV